MPISEIRVREPRSVPTIQSQNCCMQWLWRCWQQICECFALLRSVYPARRVAPQPRTIIPITPPTLTPSKAEKLIEAFCIRLSTLPPESRSTKFIGAALFFSLSPFDKYALLSRLKSALPEMSLSFYLQELQPELQECFTDALETGVKTLSLETHETAAQHFLQSCLFDLLVMGAATKVPAGFEKCILIDQLRILHFLYRILYYSGLKFANRDPYIHQLLAKLPEAIQRDIAAKAKTPAVKELYLSLNKHYIKPAASSDPQIVKQTFFNLYENVDCPDALETFARLSREDQAPILAIIEGMLLDDKYIRAYQLAAFKKLPRDAQCVILNGLVDEDRLEEYVDVAHPTIRERVQLLWEHSMDQPFSLIVKTALLPGSRV